MAVLVNAMGGNYLAIYKCIKSTCCTLNLQVIYQLCFNKAGGKKLREEAIMGGVEWNGEVGELR